MIIDRYTKAVLTVIAACLLFQCVMMAGKVVEAQQAADPWTVASGPAQPVLIVNKSPLLVESNRPLPVSITQSPLPVAVTDVRHTNGPWDPIDVRVQPAQGAPLPGYGKP